MSNLTLTWGRYDQARFERMSLTDQRHIAWKLLDLALKSCVVRRTLGSLSNNASGNGLCCYCLSNRAKVNIKNHLSGQRAIVRPACPAASIVLITEKQGGHARLRVIQCGYLRWIVVYIVLCKKRLSIRIGGAEIAACWKCMIPPSSL
jgi:hypothetical protein